MKKNNLVIGLLLILGLYVLMLKKTTAEKNKILIVLIPLSLIALFSPAFLFILLLPIFILLVFKTYTLFNPYFFTDIKSNIERTKTDIIDLGDGIGVNKKTGSVTKDGVDSNIAFDSNGTPYSKDGKDLNGNNLPWYLKSFNFPWVKK